MSDNLNAPDQETRKQQALANFASQGIDENNPPAPSAAPLPTSLADSPAINKEAVAEGMTSIPCMISIDSILVYTHLTVTASIGTFTGSAGGLGVGDMTAAGVLYYSDEAALLATEDFGVFFGSDMGGVCQITWVLTATPRRPE
ncbi:hypothetical protein [Flavobacterium sp. 3HN19-14]|uniref:hypothetical protein n=1 Tax=Flavobacterium sp. 3HN19-14 TaxID=3448133 RepID=UPI003EE00D13